MNLDGTTSVNATDMGEKGCNVIAAIVWLPQTKIPLICHKGFEGRLADRCRET